MKHLLSSLFVVFSFSYCFSSVPTILLESKDKAHSFASEEIAYFIDTTLSLSIDEIKSDQSLFSLIRGDHIFPAHPQHTWLAFQLKIENDDSFRNYILQFGNAHIGEYELYIYDDVGLISKKRQGDNFPFYQREVRHNFFVHNLPDISGDHLNIFLKIDQDGQETIMPIDIFGRNYFIQHTLNVKIFHGLIIGLFLITSIVTFILFIVYKDKFFLYEVVVSIASILYIISEEGYGLMMLWPNSPYMNGLSRPISINIVIIFSLLFTIDFLKLEDKKKVFKYISYLSIGFCCLYMLFAHPLDILNYRNEQNIGTIIFGFLLLSFFNCILIAGYALISWVKDKNKDGMVVFLVFVATLISVGIRLLAIKGFGSSSDLVQHTGFITRGIHIPLIGGYLIYSALKSFKETQKVKISLLEEKAKSTRAIIENIDVERQRISMALHDSAGSIITGLKANLQMIKEDYRGIDIDQHYISSLQMSDQLQQEIRNISNDLLPSSITKLGLVAEIKKNLQHIENTFDIKTRLETNVNKIKDRDNKILFHLYYIIREALDNITKYADAKNILVQYFEYDDEIHLVIEDDGNGFEYQSIKEIEGNGLKNMALRVSWLDGTIDIYAESGTSISINIPIKKSNS